MIPIFDAARLFFMKSVFRQAGTKITMRPAGVQSDTVNSTIRAEIDSRLAALHEVSREIHTHPETNFQEYYAHDYLSSVLETHGYAVERKYAGIATSFRAEAVSAHFQASKHGTVVICCEYDALPQIGHACGHNLIAECSIGAFLGLAAAIKVGLVSGKAVLLGTPAEEGGGGKIKLIEAGAFKNIDFSIMAHGGPVDVVCPTILGFEHVEAVFEGKAAHASAGPWEGVNALDACVAAYNSLAMMRQQMKPYNRLHCIITEGGVKQNIIPERAVMEVGFRSPTVPELRELIERGTRIIKLAAEAHGCTVALQTLGLQFAPMMHNQILGNIYAKYEEQAGTDFTKNEKAKALLSYSTDMGNVSLQVPAIHPSFIPCDSATNVVLHTTAFRDIAATDAAQEGTIRVAKSLACVAAEVLSDAAILQAVKAEFDKDIRLLK